YYRDAADHVGMAVEIFGGGMKDDVEAMFERALDVRARKGVVGRSPDAARLRDRRYALKIHQLEERIGRGLDPDEAGRRRDRGFDRLHVGEIEIGDVYPGRTPAHSLEQSTRAAIEVIDRDNVGAGIEAFQRGGDRGDAGGKGKGGV